MSIALLMLVYTASSLPDVVPKVKKTIDIGADALEDEAVRRAVDGVDEQVFYQGKACGVVRKYSDTLLIFLLKGRRPERYRDRSSHATGVPYNGPMTFEVTVPVMGDE